MAVKPSQLELQTLMIAWSYMHGVRERSGAELSPEGMVALERAVEGLERFLDVEGCEQWQDYKLNEVGGSMLRNSCS
jgi:hypothetical protein